MIPATFWKSGAAVFNPATLPLSMWLSAAKTAYVVGTWAGNASAGGSGSVSATTNGADPTVGTALNGKNTTAFNGTTQNLTIATAASTLFTGTAGTFSVLFFATSIPTATASNYQNSTFLGEPGNSDQGFGLTTNGLGTVLLNSAASNYDDLELPFSTTGSWHLFQTKWTGSGIRARVDSAAWTSLATGGTGFAGAAANMLLGTGYSSSLFFTGRLAEVMTAASTISDANMDNVKSYVNATYGLAL